MRTSEEKKAYLRDYYAKNREALRAKQAIYNEANRDKLRAWHKEFYATNKELCRAKMAGFQAANPDYRKQYNDSYYTENRGGFIMRARVRQRGMRQATPIWADLDAIQEFYDEAARLTAETGIEHEVDHIVPLKNPLVCGLHVQFNLQVLTRTANRAKTNRFQINLG